VIKREGGITREGRVGVFQEFEILTASMLCNANLHHRAKFRADRSSRSADGRLLIFQDYGLPPSSIMNSSNFNCLYPLQPGVMAT